MLRAEEIKVGARVALTSTGMSWGASFSCALKNNPLYGSEYACPGYIREVNYKNWIQVEWDNGSKNTYGPGHLTLVKYKDEHEVRCGDLVLYHGFLEKALCKCNCDDSYWAKLAFIDGPGDSKCKVCGEWFGFDGLTKHTETVCESSVSEETNEQTMADLRRNVIPMDPYGQKTHSALMAAHREREQHPQVDLRHQLDNILGSMEIQTLEQYKPFADDEMARELTNSDDLDMENRNTKYYREE